MNLQQKKPSKPVHTDDAMYKIRSSQGMGAYAGAARRRVHLEPVLLRPPFGYRPGRRHAAHAR